MTEPRTLIPRAAAARARFVAALALAVQPRPADDATARRALAAIYQAAGVPLARRLRLVRSAERAFGGLPRAFDEAEVELRHAIARLDAGG